MEPATRDRILENLRSSPAKTVEELSRILNLTRADIRYHLKALRRDGLVVRMPPASLKTAQKRGRPVNSYQLAAAARHDSLADLSHALLSLLQDSTGGGVGLRKLADELFPVVELGATERHVSQRLNEVIRQINQRPYQASWEAHAAGPLVFFHNCPFAAVIRQHPELCRVDQFSLENLSGMAGRQIKKIDLDGPGSAVCIFSLSEKQSDDLK